ncbi:hypothetical protein [Aeromicrobium terrae]|uniref:hypothetical protein n=1 Tax=Aeromicrobium terrae TaxID=2498846 RepID=UPI00165072D9|nr:hypothetical protein [Aeromicrobium terrae]
MRDFWAEAVGVVLIAVGVAIGAVTYGDAWKTLVAAVVIVVGVGCFRYGITRRRRARRA